MSSTIDPTTGYPLVSPVTIDYLPLNVQTFPFPDMSAGQGPSRGSTYPDDIFSVMGHVAGYRQDNPRQDQVVYTDGKHALWVYQVNASGGGGGTANFAPPKQSASYVQDFSSVSWNVGPTNWNGATALYVVSIGYVIDTAGPAWLNPIQTILCRLDFGGSFTKYLLANFTIGGSQASPSKPADSITLTFPGGFPLTDAAGNKAQSFDFQGGEATCHFNVSYTAG